MVIAPGCPDPSVLEQLALGQIAPDEVERLAAHCETCESCVTALQQLGANDTLIEAMRSQNTSAEMVLPESVRQLMQAMKRLGAAAAPVAAETLSSVRSPDPRSAEDAPSEPAAKAAYARELYDFPAPAETPDELGRLGTYRVLKVLGAGGMGVVFLAEEPELKRRVALKTMKPALAASGTARERFLREAQAMAAAQHDHIVHINRIGQERGIPFLAMPYLDGETLEARLQREGRLAPAEAVRIGREVAEGLAAAHERGLIHRDIKPANVWLEGKRGRVKILDFGLARAASGEGQLTQPGAIAGTPAYMSPEQAQGGTVDQRSDLLAFGCVLYRLTVGYPPFKGADPIATLISVATDHPTPPAELNPAVPQALSELTMRLLAKTPGDRPPSAQEVAEALRVIERALATALPLVSGSSDAPAELTVGRRSNLGRVMALAGVLLLVLLPPGYFFGATVIRVVTNKGELVIETDDPNIEVTIKQQTAIIHDREKGRSFVLTPGDYDVEVRETDGGLRFSTKRFSIIRGGKERLNVRLELANAVSQPATPKGHDAGPKTPADGPNQGKASSVASDSDADFARWLLSIGGRVGVRPEGKEPVPQIARAQDLPSGRFEVSGFDLWGNPSVNDDTSDWIVRWLKRTGVEEIGFFGTRVGDATAAKLVGVKTLKRIQLGSTQITDRALELLAARTDLLSLAVSETAVTDAGLSHVARMTNLEEIYLGSTRVTEQGLQKLAGLSKLRRLSLRGLPVTSEWLARLRGSRLEWLDVSGAKIRDAGIEHLRQLPELTELHAARLRLTDAAIPHLVACKNLESLVLDDNPITDAGLEKLASMTWLKVVHIGGNRVTDAGLNSLRRALPGCEILPKPKIDSTQVGAQADSRKGSDFPEPTKALASSHRRAAERFIKLARLRVWAAGREHDVAKGDALPTESFVIVSIDEVSDDVSDADLELLRGLGDIRILKLFDCRDITDKGVAHLSKLTRLTCLVLPNTRTSDQGLAQLRNLTQLQEFVLGGTRITNAGLTHLSGMEKLSFLDIGRTEVTDAGLVHLPGLRRLNRLHIYDNQITNAGLKQVGECKELQHLEITNLPISDAGLQHLRGLTELKLLFVNHVAISDAGLEHLKGLRRLRYVQLRQTKVSAEGIKRLAAALPRCQIISDFGTTEPAPLGTETPARRRRARQNLEPGPPVSSAAFVARPPRLPGVQSWSLETVGSRGGSFAPQQKPIALSPDGDRLANVVSDLTIRVWDLSSGKLERILLGHEQTVRDVEWSPDGNRLASCDNSRLIIWDVASGRADRQVQLISTHLGSRLAWSPDGRRIATAEDMLRIRDADSLRPLAEFAAQGAASIAWSPNGRILACATENDTVLLWDVTTKQLRRRWKTPGTDRRLVWSPDGKTLTSSSGGPGVVRFWDVETGQPRLLQRQDWLAFDLARSADGKLIATCPGNKVELCDAASGMVRGELAAPRATMFAAWSRNGKTLAAMNAESSIVAWDMPSRQVRFRAAAHPWAMGLSWSPDGSQLTFAANRRNCPVLRPGYRQTESHRPGCGGDCDFAGRFPPGRRLYSPGLSRRESRVDRPGFSSQAGRVAAGGGSERSCLVAGWQAASSGERRRSNLGRPLRKVLQTWKQVAGQQRFGLDWSPDGRMLATGERGQLRLWDTQAAKQSASNL